MSTHEDKPWRHYERHQDDEVYDRVEIVCEPRFKTSGLSGDEWRVSYATRLWRKGTMLHERRYHRLSDAVAHLPWLLRTHIEECQGEDERRWCKRIEADKRTCHQPGCGEKASVLYRMVKRGSKDGCFVEPVEECNVVLRAFCDRHSTRGDSDMTDNDANYVLVSGQPQAPRAADESPAAFGGVVDLGDDKGKPGGN